jgi:hypothetical protein
MKWIKLRSCLAGSSLIPYKLFTSTFGFALSEFQDLALVPLLSWIAGSFGIVCYDCEVWGAIWL